MAASTAARSPHLAYGLISHMISQACSYYLEALRRPLLVTIVMYVGVVINIFANLALVAGWWGFPQMGAEGVAWATTGTRWMIAAIMLIFVAALTPGFRRSPPAAREARLQLEVGTGTAISTSPNGAVSTSPSSYLGLHRGQRCLWLFGAGDGRVLHVLSRHRHGHIRARGGRLSGGAIRKR